MKKFQGMLLLSDMDGTILNDKKEISQENKDAVKYFTENGGYFSLATGRSKRSMDYYVEELHINAPVVVYNGSGVYDFKNERYIFEKNMNETCVEFVRDMCGKFSYLAAEVYLKESEFVVQPNDLAVRHFVNIRLPMIEKRPEEIELPWVKVNFVAPKDKVDEVENYARSAWKDKWFYQRSGSSFFEAMSVGVDKGTGALAVCDYMGVDRKFLFTAGDHMNDIELIEAAGISFCPENSVPYIKEIADVTVSDNNHHTIASVVEYLDRKF